MSSILNEYYFYRGYAFIHNFGSRYSECSVIVEPRWRGSDITDQRPIVRVVEHYIVVYSGVHGPGGFVENSGPGRLELKVINTCPCGGVFNEFIELNISPTIVEDTDLTFPRDSGFIQFAHIETSLADCVTWVVQTTNQERVPLSIPVYNNLIIMGGLDVIRDGTMEFVDYPPETEVSVTAIQSNPCAQVTIQ